MTMFQHLHIHSHYSMMWGTAPIDALGEHLCREGQKVFPLTDRNGIYGMIEHLQVCQRLGLRPIVGSELVTADEQALCLVKTETGYHNLCNMLTQLYRRSDFCLHDALRDRHEGLVVVTQSPRILAELRHHADVYIDLYPGHIAQGLALHDTWKVPMVVTSHAYMISERAHAFHRLLRAVDMNHKLSNLPAMTHMPKQSSLLPRATMAERFYHYPEALKASWEIAEACRYTPSLGPLIFPPSDYNHHFKVLRDKTFAGISKRYGSVRDALRKRADYELDMIRRKGFANCFLVIEDVVGRFPLTCGRGSAAASLVSYALGITHVDPMAHNLFFERFLNPGRQDPPDIDVDFAWDERNQVRDYLWEKYGGEHVAMVCNHNRFKVASAIREVGKVFGLSHDEIGQAAEKLRVLKRYGKQPKLAAPWPTVFNLARRLVGQPRHLSVHCGGVVLTPDPMTNHCPLRPMPIGYDVVPWDKDGVEAYGFVKLDFLGNRSLAVIRDCLRSVRENYHVAIDYQTLNPLDDRQTQSLISKGNTMGCFYVESPATRQLLEKTGHGDYGTLVAISSIIRPAANKIAAEWVRRHRWMLQKGNRANWRVVHPVVEETLEENHGLMIYQEDVSRVAMALAGFDAVDADRLRKIMSKKDKEKVLADYRRRFGEGCRKKGCNNDQIAEIWSMIESFAGYSFCKPHSASYAMVSFKSAFLKFHYPAEFLAAVIANGGGFYSAYAYLSHARRLGLEILGPDINDSRLGYRGYNGRIRMGLSQIKGLKRETLQKIINRRHQGSYSDLEDFLHRVQPSLEEAKRFILAGCFDELEDASNRPTLVWRALHWFARHQQQNGGLLNEVIRRQDLPQMAAYDEKTRLNLEEKLFGFVISQHPLARYESVLRTLHRIRTCDLKRYHRRHVTLAGWLITGKTVHTKDDQPMCFLTFEDETGLVEAVMFPELYHRRSPLLGYARPFIIKGEVVCDMGSFSLTLHDIISLEQAHKKPKPAPIYQAH